MYLWNTKQLAKDLKNATVPDNDKYKYIIALMIIVGPPMVTDNKGELSVNKILKPSCDNKEFNSYVDNLLSQIKEFSNKYMELIKNV